jgi:hypothetical protein
MPLLRHAELRSSRPARWMASLKRPTGDHFGLTILESFLRSREVTRLVQGGQRCNSEGCFTPINAPI